MAQKVTVQYVDDLDGSPLSGRASTVSFGLEGASYEIDLSAENRAKLRAALAPFIKAGRKTPGSEVVVAPRRSGARRKGAGSKTTSDAGAIREWAKVNGHAVNERGRIPAELRAAYEAAN